MQNLTIFLLWCLGFIISMCLLYHYNTRPEHTDNSAKINLMWSLVFSLFSWILLVALILVNMLWLLSEQINKSSLKDLLIKLNNKFMSEKNND